MAEGLDQNLLKKWEDEAKKNPDGEYDQFISDLNNAKKEAIERNLDLIKGHAKNNKGAKKWLEKHGQK